MDEIEELFEAWWKENKNTIPYDALLSEAMVKKIWLDGCRSGYHMGSDDGRRDAVKENW